LLQWQHSTLVSSTELLYVVVPGIPKGLNVTERLPTMLILYAEEPNEDGGMPVIGYRVEYDNITLYDLELHHLRVSLKAIKETRRKFTVYLNLCVMLWELLKSKFKDQSHEKIQNIQQGVF